MADPFVIEITEHYEDIEKGNNIEIAIIKLQFLCISSKTVMLLCYINVHMLILFHNNFKTNVLKSF